LSVVDCIHDTLQVVPHLNIIHIVIFVNSLCISFTHP
jgi:hypothetical protein